MGKKVGSRIRNEQPRSYFPKLKNHFFLVKILKFMMRIRKWKKFGSGMEKSRIRDPENIPDENNYKNDFNRTPDSVFIRQNLSAITLNSQGATRRKAQESVLWIQIRLDPHTFGCPGSGSVLGMKSWIQKHGN
jgi:hypothetical protein